jgi:hypothetical protein
LWQQIVKAKYLQNCSVASGKDKFNDSPVWKILVDGKCCSYEGQKSDFE